ncbi:MAG: aminotransferase class I/II-fold pyridoxal phosphate-dependent enzyme [Deltaproteobacteria bacterium]|nr:aminotransferase class I/II-fold pyridoxal phosphate-dependent enzyme [Deltaproteobacteria bacterium]
MKIKSKLPNIGTTIFSIMSQMAAEYYAINLSQGFPDFDVNGELIERVNHYMKEGFNQYAPMPGVPVLREKISQKISELYGKKYDPDSEITVTSGATEALYAAISTVVNPGDEVIVFEPAYDSYLPAIELNGGITKFIQLKFPEYSVDWDLVRDTITDKTRLIIINSPHNPTGTILTIDDLKELSDVVKDREIFILSDEVYEHIVFDGQKHESISSFEELAKRSFVVSSFGKTYHATGWKIGYCVAPRPLMAEFQKIRQFVTFTTNTPMQYAIADILDKRDLYLNLSGFYQQKRDLFLKLIEKSRFKAVKCLGTYFQMLDYSSISDEKDMAFAELLTKKHGVAAIPPSVFYDGRDDNKVLRFCFAKKDDTLEEAADILCKI